MSRRRVASSWIVTVAITLVVSSGIVAMERNLHHAATPGAAAVSTISPAPAPTPASRTGADGSSDSGLVDN